MKKMNRRNFIAKGSMGLGAAAVLSGLSSSIFAETNRRWMNQPIGFQTYPIREMVVKDFPGTLKLMAGQGYQLVEMCSPQGYVTSGFGPLVNIKPAEMRHIIEDAGLHCPSCHFTFPELTDNLDERIEFANQLGLTQMICSTFWLPKTATLNDYLDSADKLNKSAEKIKKAGM
ncbi:MAG TPA: twin-arginine translocation signal domain-containing protein, partial [Puia sp.]